MIFLGQAANYNAGRILRHLVAWGTEKDFAGLAADLAQTYNTEVQNVALYHSGRTALMMAIKAVAEPESKVIIPGLTCIAVVRAVRAAGCEPVYCDLNTNNLEYNYAMLEQLMARCAMERPGGVVLVQNTLGISWDVRRIEMLAQKYHFVIVEDLAHSAGRAYPDGRMVGTVGAAAALSFGKGKAIDTINGGAVVIRKSRAEFALVQPQQKPRLSERLRDRWYPVFGGLTRVLWKIKVGEVLLAVLVKLRWIKKSADTQLDERVRLTWWQAKLARAQLANLAKTSPGPLREYKLVNDRAKLLRELYDADAKLDEIWYTEPVSPERYMAEANFPMNQCPVTIKLAESIVNIPTWYDEAKLQKAREIIARYEIDAIQNDGAGSNGY